MSLLDKLRRIFSRKGETSYAPPTSVRGAGVRTCATCGIGWKSTVARMKDLGLAAGMTATYDPANLMGLTCTHCGKSFCKRHLGQEIPSFLPGGTCPSCGGAMDLA